MDGLTVLVEAKKEYMAQLCGILCTQMIEVFELMYGEAAKNKKIVVPNMNSPGVLPRFQVLLRDVKNWNNTIIEKHLEKLKNSCSWFEDLVAAVFVSYVKILSSVRLKSNSEKINVKLPQMDTFLHRCYESAAADLYKKPDVYDEVMSEYDRDAQLTTRFVGCIEETVKKLLPVEEILKCTIQSRNSVSLEDEEQPAPAEDEESVPEEEPMATEGEGGEAPAEGEAQIPAPQPDTSKDPSPPMAPISEDISAGVNENIKNIPVTGADDVLFPDARD
jgi:hypothetical protein